MNIYKNFYPEVSIILATYNRANLIRGSVDSVICQSFTNWELIIVDDGSTDDTYNLIKDYQKNHQNIRYLRHSHKKLPLTRNAGIQASIGNYITFIDSDDTYLQDHIILRIQCIQKNPEIDLLHGGYVAIGNPYVADKNDYTKLIHLDDCYIGGTFFGKREVFMELKGFRDIQFSEDSDFMERALLKYKVNKIHFPTYIYHRDIQDSICNSL